LASVIETQTTGEEQNERSILSFVLSETKPRGKWLIPFNIISIPIILLGIILLWIRFTKGLSAVTNLSQDFPWGLWIGLDVNVGVAFAGGAYVLTFMVYILGLKKYHCLLFILSMKRKSLLLIRISAIMALIGIILNRLNVSIIAFRWNVPVRYYPSWMEIEITLAIVFAEIWVFRWFVRRMPVLEASPAWALEQDARTRNAKHPEIVKEVVSWKPQT
jgi:Ni/Fe-hydrogenase subunit HybB-like protein